MRRLSQPSSQHSSTPAQERQPTHFKANEMLPMKCVVPVSGSRPQDNHLHNTDGASRNHNSVTAMPSMYEHGSVDFSPASVDGATTLRSPPEAFGSSSPSVVLDPPLEEQIFSREGQSLSQGSSNPLVEPAKASTTDKPVGTDLYGSPREAGEFDVYKRAKKRDGSAEMTGHENSDTKSGCCMQLGHTMLRVLLLMRRELCSTICELLIPIIFVIGSVILWAIFGTTHQDAEIYYDASSIFNFDGLMALVRSQTCVKAGGAAIPNLSPCPADSDMYCPVGRGVPDGLCYNATAEVGGVTLQLLILGVGTFFQSTTAPVPNFDDLVLLHWLNLDEKFLSRGADSSSIASGGMLFFAPDTAETRGLVDYMRSNNDYFDLVYGQTFATVADAEAHVKATKPEDPPNWGIIQVNSMSASSFDVSIRLNSSAVPSSGTALNTWYIGGLSAGYSDKYISSGFVTLQVAVYEYYLSQVQGYTATIPSLTYTPMSTAELNSKDFIAYGGQFAPLILVLGFLYPVSQLTRRIVVEKELRIREAMLIMGLSEAVMYLAWFIIYGLWYIVLSLICAIILRFTYFPETSFGYTFFMFLFFSWSTMTLSGLLASFFSRARLSAILAPLIYFVLAIPLFAMQSAPPGAKIGVSILSPSAFALCCTLIFEHEARGGAQTNDLNNKQDKPTLLICFIFLFCDIFVYLILMMYFDCIIPKQWGTTKNPFFCIIDPIKWCCCRNNNDEDEDDENLLEDGRAPDGVFEKEFDAEEATVRILGLRKKFKRGGKKFLAVNNLYWSLRQGEISVLLGHNGAGKSTTMNIMTGMLEADGGDCVIYGKSIRTQLTEARQEIGLCPQHNILWPLMTVEEHLTYFAAIKGLRGTRREHAVTRMLAGVDFEDKRHYRSSALSGGQKRKLSVAIAFVGGSRLVFLDEPTAGMDVGARRHTWGLVRDMANDHTILLTTHFMDEADLLGSSVAIMSQGRLQCSGSNMFLKSKLGGGFVMTMSVVAHVNRQNIQNLIRAHVDSAEAMGSGAGEVAYRLPQASKPAFPALLSAVEEQSKALGINAYSLSATTLEEVFLRIAEKDLKGEELHADETAQATSAVWNVDLIEKRNSLLWSQFSAMMVKRFWNAIRDARTVFFQIICPVVCVMLAMLLTLVKFWNYPTLTLSGNIYDTTVEIPISNCGALMNASTPFAPDTIMDEWTGVTDGSIFAQRLLDTYFTHPHDRYVGLLCTTTDLVGYSALFYNNSALHEVAMGTRNYYNAILQFGTSGAAPQLVTKAEVMPKTQRESAVQDSIYAMMIAVIIMIPFSFIPSTFVAWVVKERECKARHLQNVSGLSFYVYWLSNFLFDLACYIVTMFLVIAIFGIFNRTEYIAKDKIGATIVLFLLYGISGILMAYALSFLFSNHSTAQNVVMLANFVVGFLLVLAISSLRMIDSTRSVADVLRWIFRIVPSYDVGEGISNLATLKILQAFGFEDTAWSMNTGIGWPSVYMAVEIPVLLFITLFVDHPGRRQRSQRLMHNPDAPPEVIDDQDPDVIAEKEAVEQDADRANDLVTVRALRKVYSNGKVAVRNITFGVKPGEVFGFLGTNGAGKTTTISILCQEFYPTSGHAAICGHDIVKNSQSALRCIGYCPQFDACLDLLTVEEHLYLYAGVRGITKGTRKSVVEGLMKLCELTMYRKTKSHELSGGNRRKLSVAISLIGGPRVVFLDEPSAGMDPVARRGLWTAVETVADNCSIVLTTHHLEEVEALAHRVAIMVDGALHCIGDKTHLKQKFGTGYEVTVRVHANDKETLSAVENFFQNTFDKPELVEVRATRVTYQVPKDRPLSAVFSLLEEHRIQLGITDYNISQTSIEQVFLRISEEAEAKEDEERMKNIAAKKGCCSCCC